MRPAGKESVQRQAAGRLASFARRVLGAGLLDARTYRALALDGAVTGEALAAGHCMPRSPKIPGLRLVCAWKSEPWRPPA